MQFLIIGLDGTDEGAIERLSAVREECGVELDTDVKFAGDGKNISSRSLKCLFLRNILVLV